MFDISLGVLSVTLGLRITVRRTGRRTTLTVELH
jgi:hypothetical protein